MGKKIIKQQLQTDYESIRKYPAKYSMCNFRRKYYRTISNESQKGSSALFSFKITGST